MEAGCVVKKSSLHCLATWYGVLCKCASVILVIAIVKTRRDLITILMNVPYHSFFFYSQKLVFFPLLRKNRKETFKFTQLNFYFLFC